LGNLRTAWISREWARALATPWIVRFEDIDRPRVLEGSRESQLADMRALGLVPDEVLTQSEFADRHWEALVTAIDAGLVYACDCSRKDVQDALAGLASAPHPDCQPAVYSGRCRKLPRRETRGAQSIAWRFRMPDDTGAEDFIVARTRAAVPDRESFVPSYQWACAVDDFDGGYRLLVRASDLKSSARSQQAVQGWLAKRTPGSVRLPAIFHTSLVVQNDGHRLEKRTAGVTLSELQAAGFTPERLIETFEKSFNRSVFASLPVPGSLLGEDKETLSLADLGLPPGA
jgi:glutamyl/glutaminyl-tRNA synthetase